MPQDFRIGQGFDMHRFARGRKLVLGGVEIPHRLGLSGHSDADVLLHALVNALLGAIGEGDIGSHFPDSDPRYKGIASTKLLAQVSGLVKRRKFKLVNADMTLIAQEPKLSPYYSTMRRNVANVLAVQPARISIKAATTEKLGPIGRGKGIAAMAVVLLRA